MILRVFFNAGLLLVFLTDLSAGQGLPTYRWEKQLGWKIRMNRGPKDAWGDLPTSIRLLRRAEVAEKTLQFYSAAYERLVAQPDASFADLASDTSFIALCEQQGRLLLGGPMLGVAQPHGVKVWLRTLAPSEVSVLVTDGVKSRLFGPVRRRAATDLSAVISIDGLRPDTRYEYRVLVDGEEASLPVGASFTTASLPESHGTTRIAFGGDFHRWGFAHKPLFDTLLSRTPTAMLLTGDIAVSDRFTHRGLHRADYLLRDCFPEWNRLASRVPLYAIWDDHDYLDNDLGGRPRRVSQQQQIEVWEVFHNSWNNPSYGFNDPRRGVFFRTRIGPADLIMLDNKFFRQEATADHPATLLGDDQMRWLKQQLLDCKGPFIILACGTMWTDHVSDGKDSWGRFSPADRERLFRLIEDNRVGGVLLISADRHGACGYRIPRASGFQLHEFGVGSLGGIRGNLAPAGKAPNAGGDLLYRYGEGYAFGEFEFDTTLDDPTVTFRLIQDDGQVLHQWARTRSQLTPRAT